MPPPVLRQPAEPHADANRFVFDLVAAFILFLTALAGACAPLYLAGYNMIFGSSAEGGRLSAYHGGQSSKRSMAFVIDRTA